MNYFKILGIVFGLVALLKPFYMHILPWDENKAIAKAYDKKRPGWVVPAALVGLGLVAFTWYKHFTTEIQYSIVITILFSLTAIKGLILIFDYEKFQKWIAGMLQRNKGEIVLVDIGAGIIGLIMVVLTLIFY